MLTSVIVGRVLLHLLADLLQILVLPCSFRILLVAYVGLLFTNLRHR